MPPGCSSPCALQDRRRRAQRRRGCRHRQAPAKPRRPAAATPVSGCFQRLHRAARRVAVRRCNGRGSRAGLFESISTRWSVFLPMSPRAGASWIPCLSRPATSSVSSAVTRSRKWPCGRPVASLRPPDGNPSARRTGQYESRIRRGERLADRAARGSLRIPGDVQGSIGVALTDSCLMVPNKSVSGIFYPSVSGFESCQLCGKSAALTGARRSIPDCGCGRSGRPRELRGPGLCPPEVLPIPAPPSSSMAR